VYAFIVSRVHNRDDAQDLTAEVFQQALANLPQYEWRGVPFKSWLLRIASNAIADRWQRLARQGSQRLAEEAKVDPEQIEYRAMLFELVGSLPADQQRVIVMRFVEQKRIREIAQELGRSEGAVKQLQFRALQTLRANMRDRHA
jgi:RNA polymerase sigma-70 factor (ECF subfamily)